MIADWLASAGLGALKPVLSSLVLPPAPFVALALVGACLVRARPRAARWLVAVGCVGLWFGSCTGVARLAENWLDEPAALTAAQRTALKARGAAGEPIAIVVLGGGMTDPAPEYGRPNLSATSFSRLRYGAWLARETGLPLAASGGRGWSAPNVDIPPEAQRMAEIAQDELRTPLRWSESGSRDTHENAVATVALMRSAGIHEIVLVTTGTHMPRALREFRAAAAASAASGATPLAVTPATMGQAFTAGSGWLAWLPSGEGALRVHDALHEVVASVR